MHCWLPCELGLLGFEYFHPNVASTPHDFSHVCDFYSKVGLVGSAVSMVPITVMHGIFLVCDVVRVYAMFSVQ